MGGVDGAQDIAGQPKRLSSLPAGSWRMNICSRFRLQLSFTGRSGVTAIAARIRELNATFRENVKTIAGLTLHTPIDPELSAGLSCFEVQGVKPEEVDSRLAAKKIRTNASPYKVSYAARSCRAS